MRARRAGVLGIMIGLIVALVGQASRPAGIEPAAAAAGNAPLTCLRQAHLVRPHRQGPGLWAATDRRTAQAILVDGPYRTATEAQKSAASLRDVASAVRGGRYVVSAPLRAHVESRVRTVGRCLDRRR